MKRLYVVVAFMGIFLTSAFGQTTIESVVIKDARSLGAGGTSLLFSIGYDSFFGNPAGFAGPGSLTLGDASFWGYAPITPSSLKTINYVFSGQASKEDFETAIDDFLAENNQIGFGGAIGLGWAGKGIGLGTNIVSEALLYGADFASSKVIVRNQLNVIAGYALPINLGFIKIALGVDARGFYRLDSVADSWNDGYDIVMAAIGSGAEFGALIAPKAMRGGLGYAFDAGATIAIGPLSAGFMARNLIARIQLGDTTIYDMVINADFPVDGTNLVTLEPVYTAGLKLSINEKGLVAPSLYLETDDIPGIAEAISTGSPDTSNLLSSIRAGGELKLLGIFVLRGGLNSNLLSVGAGIDLYIVRADIAMFQESLGAYQNHSGITARVALKF